MADKIITTQPKQTLIDIAVQEYGAPDTVFDLLRNNKTIVSSITDDLAAGTRLKIVGTPLRPDIVNFLKENGIVPASGYTPTTIEQTEFSNDFDDDFN